MTSILNFNPNGRFLQLTPFQKFISQNVSRILNTPLVNYLTCKLSVLSIRSAAPFSGILQQIFSRKDSFTGLYRFLLLNDGVVSTKRQTDYRNGLILAIMDLFFGTVFGAFLLSEASIFNFNSWLYSVQIGIFETYLDWFMGWPAGFKFNANLTRFLGRFFLQGLFLWKSKGILNDLKWSLNESSF